VLDPPAFRSPPRRFEDEDESEDEDDSPPGARMLPAGTGVLRVGCPLRPPPPLPRCPLCLSHR